MKVKDMGPEKLLEEIQKLTSGKLDPEYLVKLTREINEMEGKPPPEEMKGCISDFLPPKEKAVKYVELLWGNEDKVLMGEPASFTSPFYSIMPNFNMQDLEFFSAFCGLAKLSKEGYYIGVEKEMLKQKESLDNIAKWVSNPPKIVRGTSNPLSYKEQSTKVPQKGKDYAKIFSEGPFNLLNYLFGEGSSPQVHIHFTNSSELPNFVTRLVDLIGRTEEEFTFLKKVSMKVLAKIGRYSKGMKEMRKHKTTLCARLENLDDSDAKTIIASIDGSTRPVDEKEDLRGLGCAVCGSLTNLKKCSRCFSKHYCGAECQKSDWPSHKMNCVPKK